MAKKKGLSYEEKMLNALEKLPNPIIDKKHNIRIYIIDDRARSNQSKFEHIIESRHGLRPSDIEKIPKRIKKCIFRRDKERKETFNIYLKRSNIREEYIKISVRINPQQPDIAIIKTIYVTQTVK